jgi:hypothetical protein
LLDAVVVKNAAVRLEERGDAYVLWVPIRRRWWMRGLLGWLLPFRDEKGIALDALGRELWSECDGERSLETLIERFAARHRLRFHEARLSVQAFVRSLMERNLVALVLADAADAAGEGGP